MHSQKNKKTCKNKNIRGNAGVDPALPLKIVFLCVFFVFTLLFLLFLVVHFWLSIVLFGFPCVLQRKNKRNPKGKPNEQRENKQRQEGTANNKFLISFPLSSLSLSLLSLALLLPSLLGWSSFFSLQVLYTTHVGKASCIEKRGFLSEGECAFPT